MTPPSTSEQPPYPTQKQMEAVRAVLEDDEGDPRRYGTWSTDLAWKILRVVREAPDD